MTTAPQVVDAGTHSLTGHWIGLCDVDGEPVYCEMNWPVDDEVQRGTLTLSFGAGTELEINGVRVENGRAHFAVDHPSGCWLFDGALAAGQLQGAVSSPQGQGTFRLMAVTDQDPDAYDAYNGSYWLAPDRAIGIAAYRGEMGCPYPVCVDFGGGSLRALFPLGADRFVAGPSFMVPLPPEITFEFGRDASGQVTGLHWQEAGQAGRWAPRIALRQEAVRFGHGAATLAGTITFPLADPPHPALVLVHGSGPQPRDHAVLKWIADWFALQGVAVLAYDKRGVGESTGDWTEASLEDLAGDALAAVAYFQSRPEIRADAVGLWGISQGGWIAPLAAARSRDVAFIILVSGPGVSVAQQDVDRVEGTMRLDGFTEAEAKAAAAHQRLFYDLVAASARWEEFEASMQWARQARWAGYVALPSKERFDLRVGVLRPFFGYDPVPDLERVTCPVLALFGGRDAIVPPERNVAPMEQALRRGGNGDHTILVFPAGDHVLTATQSGAFGEVPFAKALVLGYLDALREWLVKHELVEDV
jgi:pimeloyl-ACP methyl ester carboxylesterase